MRPKLVKILVILFIIAGLIYIFCPGFIKLKRLSNRRAELIKKIQDLKEANLQLEKEAERLTNDMIYIEKMVRQKLGVAREGETVYRFAPNEEEKEIRQDSGQEVERKNKNKRY